MGPAREEGTGLPAVCDSAVPAVPPGGRGHGDPALPRAELALTGGRERESSPSNPSQKLTQGTRCWVQLPTEAGPRPTAQDPALYRCPRGKGLLPEAPSAVNGGAHIT